MANKFNFVGTYLIPKAESKRPFTKEFDKKGKKMISLNFGVKESDNNLAYVEGFDSTQDVIKTMNSDNEKIEIKWADRFDEDVVKTVANYKKYTIDLGEDFGGRKDFISQYDAILHIKEWLPKYKGKIAATGQFVKEPYNGQYYDKFKIQNIYAVPDDTKSRLSLQFDIYYNKDSVDKEDFKEDKKIYLNGYIDQYINKDEKNKYISQQFVFNTSKYDLENNEKHKKLFDYKLGYIDVKNKTMVHIPWEVVLLRGADGVEWNESMLTKSQKEQVELGIKTVDDFKPRGQVLGDKVNEYRLFDPILRDFGKEGNFTDGVVDTELKLSEFEEMIYVPVKDEKLEDVVKSSNKTEEVKVEKEETSTPTVDDDDLF